MKAVFSARRSLPCMLAGAVVLAGASSFEDVAQARTQQASGDKKQVWSVTTCMAMIGDDPYGARDYALDWLHHGGGRDARHCHALALLEAGDEDESARELDELAHQTAPKGDVPPPACVQLWRMSRRGMACRRSAGQGAGQRGFWAAGPTP